MEHRTPPSRIGCIFLPVLYLTDADLLHARTRQILCRRRPGAVPNASSKPEMGRDRPQSVGVLLGDLELCRFHNVQEENIRSGDDSWYLPDSRLMPATLFGLPKASQKQGAVSLQKEVLQFNSVFWHAHVSELLANTSHKLQSCSASGSRPEGQCVFLVYIHAYIYTCLYVVTLV